MKAFWVIFAIVVAGAIIYLMVQNNKKKPININNLTTSSSGGYALGLSLANLIANTKCGKEGRPPCTKDELQASGWSPEQIAQAEAASGQVKDWSLCYSLGINC